VVFAVVVGGIGCIGGWGLSGLRASRKRDGLLSFSRDAGVWPSILGITQPGLLVPSASTLDDAHKQQLLLDHCKCLLSCNG
jgi:hypothetical protein